MSTWTRPDRGALFVVTGASGTGKTTLVKEALAVVPGIQWSVSATTRAPRRGEVDGRDYHFLTRERFDALLGEGAFLEWAEVYGNRYGTLRGPVEGALREGRSVLLEIDLAGARQVRVAYPEAVSIFVLPRSVADLERRLRARATDSEQVIQRRVRDARLQIAGCGEFDYLVVNDELGTAHDCFQAILVSELQRRARRSTLIREMTSASSNP
ncbi:MAG: guanylate kinase [Alphaproteobacteria bacterium]|nr:guanylate kinase [Alphaproteobacteria bacterium]